MFSSLWLYRSPSDGKALFLRKSVDCGTKQTLLPEPRISPKGWDGVEMAGPRSIPVCSEQGAGRGRGAVLGVLLGLGRGGSCRWRPPQKPQLSGPPCPTERVPFLPMSPRGTASSGQ